MPVLTYNQVELEMITKSYLKKNFVFKSKLSHILKPLYIYSNSFNMPLKTKYILKSHVKLIFKTSKPDISV